MAMSETRYEVKATTHFKKDYRLAKKRGQNIQLLREIIKKLANGEILPEKNCDHSLVGDWIGYRECHITADWLLVYRKDDEVLVLTLTRAGSHSDLNF
jgi:mRNA interferase YafQ